jgi:hypothetical protein
MLIMVFVVLDKVGIEQFVSTFKCGMPQRQIERGASAYIYRLIHMIPFLQPGFLFLADIVMVEMPRLIPSRSSSLISSDVQPGPGICAL